MSRRSRRKAQTAADARRKAIEQAQKPVKSKWNDFAVAFTVAMVLVCGWMAADHYLFGTVPRTSGSFLDSTDNDDVGYYYATTRYDGESIPTFPPEAADELAAGLAELEKAHGICFGWSLTDGATKRTQTGSSQGRDIPANRCPRWLQTSVTVGYTSDGSSTVDGANVKVQGSSEFHALPLTDDFARLGVNVSSLVEDPISGTGHAALGLPLLMIEAGALPPVEQTGTRVTPKPLPAAGGSDISASTLFVFYGIGGMAVACVGMGFWGRKRAKNKEEGNSRV